MPEAGEGAACPALGLLQVVAPRAVDLLGVGQALADQLEAQVLAVGGIAVGRRWQNKRYPERLLAVYVLGYGIGRLWIEGLRIDPTKEGAGLRLNQWMAIVLIVAGIGYLAVRAVQARRPIEHASDIAAD